MSDLKLFINNLHKGALYVDGKLLHQESEEIIESIEEVLPKLVGIKIDSFSVDYVDDKFAGQDWPSKIEDFRHNA
jgi:hypothetical protein